MVDRGALTIAALDLAVAAVAGAKRSPGKRHAPVARNVRGHPDKPDNGGYGEHVAAAGADGFVAALLDNLAAQI